MFTFEKTIRILSFCRRHYTKQILIGLHQVVTRVCDGITIIILCDLTNFKVDTIGGGRGTFQLLNYLEISCQSLRNFSSTEKLIPLFHHLMLNYRSLITIKGIKEVNGIESITEVITGVRGRLLSPGTV